MMTPWLPDILGCGVSSSSGAIHLSELHVRLLACYVRSQNRRKAKEFLSKLPPSWIEHDEARGLAIELGQQAGDWVFLRPLVDQQLRKHPDKARSWLIKLSVGLHSLTPAEFQSDLRSAPEFLHGKIREITQFAGLELRYGEPERGMRRLYRMLRNNLDEPEALSAYLISIVGGPNDLPLMEKEISHVKPGACVTLADEFGGLKKLVIDPDNIEHLTKREGFASASSPQALSLLNAVIGQRIDFPTLAFGETKPYTVVAIQSAYTYLLEMVYERADALGGLPHLKMVPVGTTGDGERDLTHMKAEIMRSSAITQKLFEAYRTGHMTLSGFSHRRGRSSVEAVLGWPNDAPPLFVGTGIEAERLVAEKLIARPDAIYVVDALTLAELVNLEVQEILGHLPKVIVSPVTHAALVGHLREAENDKSVATSTEVNGKISFIEHDAHFHKRRIEFFKNILTTLEAYCEIEPAYGTLENEENELRLADLLQEEELEVMLLARATNATVLTLDGRFRFILEVIAKVPGIWPQALMLFCASKGLVKPAKLYSATIRQFLGNRSFISLSAADLVWMVLQGGIYLQQGIRRFKVYLSSENTDFESAVRIAFEFLNKIAFLQIQLGAFGELFEHVIEAAMRHKQCPHDFENHVAKFVVELTNSMNESNHSYEAAREPANARIRFQQQHLAEHFRLARSRLTEPATNRPVSIQVVFCGKIPQLIMDN